VRPVGGSSIQAGEPSEIAVLTGAPHDPGPDTLAECRLETRQKRHLSIRVRGEMAYAVRSAIEAEARMAYRFSVAASRADGRHLQPWDESQRDRTHQPASPDLPSTKRTDRMDRTPAP
jgi:hypothetical protein